MKKQVRWAKPFSAISTFVINYQVRIQKIRKRDLEEKKNCVHLKKIVGAFLSRDP